MRQIVKSSQNGQNIGSLPGERISIKFQGCRQNDRHSNVGFMYRDTVLYLLTF